MTNAIKHVCSFCGKKKEEVKKLIVSDDVAICNECVEFCETLLKEDAATDLIDTKAVPNADPMQLKKFIDQYVIGQDKARSY